MMRSVGVLILLAVFISVDCVLKDETGKISVILLESGDLEIVPGHRLFSGVVVWAALTNSQAENGWLQLEVSSSPAFTDVVQARAAGLAEGYLTRNTIHEYYKEFFANDLCKDDNETDGEQKFCNYMRKQIDINEDWLQDKINKEADTEPYWHMVRLFYIQVDGITEGWKIKTVEQGEEEMPEDFDLKYGMRFMNYAADVWDYVEKFSQLQQNVTETPKPSKPTCSVLIKHLPDTGELYVGHNTWHEYRAMEFRFLKKYNLPYRVVPDSEEQVAAHTATMSSYPGSVFSVDDFLTLSSGLVTTETSLFIYNTSLYSATQPREQVFEPARVMAANRLARNGREWTEIASKHNSGTYNNQWMVIDYNQVTDGGDLRDGSLWVMEQLPGRTWTSDQTEVLRRKGYWASYNRAFYPEVFLLSGGAEMEQKHGSWFSYSETPRARIMARDQGSVEDEQTMIRLMRYNDFQSDPEAVVPGCPRPIPAGSIANRCDLTLPDSECSWASLDYMVGHQGYGALDMKFATRRQREGGDFWAVAGPTHGPGMPPFSWLDTNLTSLPEYRPIQVFDFQPAVTQWKLQAISDAIKQVV